MFTFVPPRPIRRPLLCLFLHPQYPPLCPQKPAHPAGGSQGLKTRPLLPKRGWPRRGPIALSAPPPLWLPRPIIIILILKTPPPGFGPRPWFAGGATRATRGIVVTGFAHLFGTRKTS